MKRKDKHIDKFLHDPLPAPEIPADDAWAGMNDILDAAASGAAGQGNVGSTARIGQAIGKMKGFTILSATLITVGTVVGIIVSQRHTASIASKNAEPAASLAMIDSAGFEKIVEKEETGKDSATVHNYNEASRPVDLVETESKETVAPSTEHAPAVNRKSALISPKKGTGNIPDHSGSNTRQHNTGSQRTILPEKEAALPRKQYTDPKQVSDPVVSGTGNKKRITYSASGDQNAFANTAARPTTTDPGASKPLAARKPTLLQPRPGNFRGLKPDLTFRVAKPAAPSPVAAKQARRISIFENLHFGPEWSLYLPVNSAQYLFTGADSIKRPARVAVPGFFVSHNWDRHAATLVFTPLHTYFGNKDLVAQRIDTIRNSDSTIIYFYNKTNFIKATGWNVALQYQFEATSWLSVSGGASYARYSRALFSTEMSNSLGNSITGPLLTTKGGEATHAFIHSQQWTLRVGLIAHPRALLNGRVQIGTNMILPISNLSRYGGTQIRSANAQVFLRLMVR